MGLCHSCSSEPDPSVEVDNSNNAEAALNDEGAGEAELVAIEELRTNDNTPNCVQSPTKLNPGPEHESNDIRPWGDLNNLEEQFAAVQQLCREARVLEAGSKLDELDWGLAAALKSQTEASNPFLEFSERVKVDPVLRKLKLLRPRVQAQLKPDALLSLVLKGEKSAWIAETVKDPSIGENFTLEVKVRFAEKPEYIAGAGACQFILCCTCSGWPQPVESFIALVRELDFGKKEHIHDCTDLQGTPGGPEQLMTAWLRYVVRPALCPLNLEFVLRREFDLLQDGAIPGYPAGVMMLEKSMPTGVADFEGWPVPPTKWGQYRMSNDVVWHASPDKERQGCASIIMAGRYGAPIPKWMAPLSIIHKVCMGTIHKTLQKLIVAALPEWDKTYGKRMQTPEVQSLYSAIGLHTRGSS
mmetsp:Transcript_10540/g.17577  ORF Transcript_10540/g.17577 Transcript_10540/m.17577 type:complete len:413 (-) Transcript_10540:195-1433(-)